MLSLFFFICARNPFRCHNHALCKAFPVLKIQAEKKSLSHSAKLKIKPCIYPNSYFFLFFGGKKTSSRTFPWQYSIVIAEKCNEKFHSEKKKKRNISNCDAFIRKIIFSVCKLFFFCAPFHRIQTVI